MLEKVGEVIDLLMSQESIGAENNKDADEEGEEEIPKCVEVA